MGKMKDYATRDTILDIGQKGRTPGRKVKHKPAYDKSGEVVTPTKNTCSRCGREEPDHTANCPTNPIIARPDVYQEWPTSEGLYFIRIRHLAHGFKEPTFAGVLWK